MVKGLVSKKLIKALKSLMNVRKQQTRRAPPFDFNRFWKRTNNELCKTDGSTENVNQQSFKLLSYNILAQDLLTEHFQLYMGINSTFLHWEHRLRCLVNEINYLEPDIFCLQEMQYSHLKELVQRIKGSRNLEYIFKKKTGSRTDGCVIIYDKDKLKLLDHCELEYFTPGITTLNRDNVAILAKFCVREGENASGIKKFVVANTHLLYNPNRHDVRIAQIDKLIGTLRDFSKANDDENLHLPILIAGDFNSEPYSPPYQQILTPHVEAYNKAADIEDTSATKTTDDVLELVPINFGREIASTYQERWTTVDYIFQSIGANRKNIQIIDTYQLPTVSSCMAVGKIPNRLLGSDHYSLAIKFTVD